MFKAIRIFILLLILLAVGMSAWRAKTNSVEWKYTLPVNIYPINADGSTVSADYIRTLTIEDFQPIETFMQQEAARYGHASNASIEIRLGKPIDSLPPERTRKLKVHPYAAMASQDLACVCQSIHCAGAHPGECVSGWPSVRTASTRTRLSGSRYGGGVSSTP